MKEVFEFNCRLCLHRVTVKLYADGSVNVLHRNGPSAQTGVAYTFLSWEVRVLGGWSELQPMIFMEELRNPVCERPFGKRMLLDKLPAELRADSVHRYELSEHGLSLVSLKDDGDAVRCVCGKVWPLLSAIFTVQDEDSVVI